MRNLEKYETWSLRVWTLGGLVVGCVVGVALLVAYGWSSTIGLAPALFGCSAHVAALQHNRELTRYRRRNGA